MIITIDGRSGTGKTTVARDVAKELGLTYFDTGAMYRSVAYAILSRNISIDNQSEVEPLLKNFPFDIRLQNGSRHYFIGENDVTSEIRSQKVTDIVSEVSALPPVRVAMWEIQRGYAERQSAVFEGRDMGSVVFPDADVKIFLDADPSVRAKRRLAEMKEKLPEDAKQFDENKMKEDLLRRDRYDSSRSLAPLICPKGALKIDTSSCR